METFHAHIYYEQSTFEKAKTLVDKAYDQEGVTVGRMHEKPVGPHPVNKYDDLASKKQKRLNNFYPSGFW